jgi:hypothetical protein
MVAAVCTNRSNCVLISCTTCPRRTSSQQRVISRSGFIPSADWFQNWIKMDPNWVFTDETYQQYWQDS